jgi:hypothetical protein
MINLSLSDEAEKFRDKYNDSTIRAAGVVAAEVTGQHMADALRAYPPATASNRPGRWTGGLSGMPRPMGYYERNRGAWYPIMTERTLYNRGRLGKARGTIAAPARVRNSVAGYRLRATSQMLGKRWRVTRTAVGALLTNAASYAAVVHDAEQQARIHAAHGWMTFQDAFTKAVQERVPFNAFVQALKLK